MLILLSTMMTSSFVYGECPCSDKSYVPVTSDYTKVNEKNAKRILKQFLKTDEYKTLEKEMASRSLYPDLKNAQVQKLDYSTGTQLFEFISVDIPFKPDCDCTSVLYGRIWAVYSQCGLGAIAQIYSRKSVEDPWTQVILGYENGQILSIDVPTLTRNCETDFRVLCELFGGPTCELFIAYITGFTSMALSYAVGIRCGIASFYICHELAHCWCYGDCGTVPGCSSYPSCICDPWEDYD